MSKTNTSYLTLLAVLLITFAVQTVAAQTDLRITGAQSGFPIALQKVCDNTEQQTIGAVLSNTMEKNLKISGVFNLMNPNSFVESSGKCDVKDVSFSDWSIIGAEGLIKARVMPAAEGQNAVTYELILYDVNKRQAVVGKRYSATSGEVKKVANKFSNEVVRYFTGTAGVFGGRIAFISKTGRFKDLFTMDLDGTNVRQITNDRGLVISPSWSADGSKLLYTSYRARLPELYQYTIDAESYYRITKSPHLEISGKYTSNGTVVAAQSIAGITNIVEFDIRGNVLKKITNTNGIDVSPSLSPNERYIAFCSNRGGNPQIYTMERNGGNVQRVSRVNSNYCTSPAWSPQGDKLAFVCREVGGFHIYVSNIDGSNPVRLTYAGSNEDPAWSPDGRFLVFSQGNPKTGVKNIMVYSLIGGNATQITFSENSENSMPVWEPVVY
jgi:TolB protein